jgi:hypothetical protein
MFDTFGKTGQRRYVIPADYVLVSVEDAVNTRSPITRTFIFGDPRLTWLDTSYGTYEERAALRRELQEKTVSVVMEMRGASDFIRAASEMLKR